MGMGLGGNVEVVMSVSSPLPFNPFGFDVTNVGELSDGWRSMIVVYWGGVAGWHCHAHEAENAFSRSRQQRGCGQLPAETTEVMMVVDWGESDRVSRSNDAVLVRGWSTLDGHVAVKAAAEPRIVHNNNCHLRETTISQSFKLVYATTSPQTKA